MMKVRVWLRKFKGLQKLFFYLKLSTYYFIIKWVMVMGLMPIKIDDVCEAEVISLENEGSGVCKVKGITVFVPKTLVGEKIRFRITEIKKNFARGKLIEIQESSPDRIVSKCPYYNECGGCDLRHQNDLKNLEFKRQKVQTAISKIGKINVKVNDVLPSFKNENYRNKASFKVEEDKIGFYVNGTYQLVDVKYCMLLEKEISDTLTVIREYIKNNNNSIKQVTIKHGNAMNEILIDVYSTDKQDEKIKTYLISNVSNLKTIIFNGKVVYGNGYISQISNGLMFNCSSNSFFQVNGSMVDKLYEVAIKEAKLSKNDVVLDLYCGTGTISCIVSSYVKKVIGIEIVDDAVIDANCNARINNVSNVKFICGDATKEISKIKEKIDVIFVDPPRKGMSRDAIAIIKKMAPKKMVYISCNPVTMARDLNYLSNVYEVKKIIPIDMFPNTNHVECVCVLSLR